MLLLAGVWTASCGGWVGEPETRFEVLLRGVERRDDGTRTTIPVEELTPADRARGYLVGRFADGALHVGVEFLSSQIEFELTNRGAKPVIVPWDRTVYVDTEGQEHRGFSSALHDGTSVVEPGRRLLVLGAPTAFTEPLPNGLALKGILNPPVFVDPMLQDDKERYCSQIGKELTFRLPVVVNDAPRTYSMHFEITDIFIIEFQGGVSRRRERWEGCSSSAMPQPFAAPAV
jgi:hypothetical protein